MFLSRAVYVIEPLQLVSCLVSEFDCFGLGQTGSLFHVSTALLDRRC
jgi:hypothetical protein